MITIPFKLSCAIFNIKNWKRQKTKELRKHRSKEIVGDVGGDGEKPKKPPVIPPHHRYQLIV
jgi:hypothetical protein